MFKLSIIIPIYNVEIYINQCLKSVFSQDVDSFSYEVIAVNDGTQDNSMSIVNKYFAHHKNLKIINQENKGLSIARNVGLNHASGKYIWFVDSDDWIDENCLGFLYNLIDEYDADVYATPLSQHKESSSLINKDFSILNDMMFDGKQYLFKKMPYGASQRFILRRDFLLRNNLEFYSGILHEDGDFGPRMLYFAKQIYVMKNSIYNYRLRSSGSIMSTWKRMNSEDLIFIHKKLENFCNNVINNHEEKYKFKCAIFNTLVVSMTFAKGRRSSKEFHSFYEENKKYIKLKGKELINFSDINIKNIVKGLITYVSPLYFAIGKEYFETLKKILYS